MRKLVKQFADIVSFQGQVLDASPAHVKALYRRGMAYMLVGDFVEAKKDFEMVCHLPSEFYVFYSFDFVRNHVLMVLIIQMMKVDRSAEPDATAALLKLKQKEQVSDFVLQYLFLAYL